ncbi:MAG: hypothetical protein R3C05_08905 [Pirellulaceae bacterium]
MKRYQQPFAMILAAIVTALSCPSLNAANPLQTKLQAKSDNTPYTYVLFYRSNDAATQKMNDVLQETLSQRDDSEVVAVKIDDPAQQALIKKFDATRLPMPTVAVLASNGAVCTVFPQRVSSSQLLAAMVSPAQARCLKALQDEKLVLLCAQPSESASIPLGVRQFQSDAQFAPRTEVVTVQARDPQEAKFLNQLRVRTDQPSTMIAFMAPPGVMIGHFNSTVAFDTLAQKLAAAGKCCDDENCKHHKKK